MNIRRAGLFGSAAIVVVVVALAPVSAFAFNSSNHGHHYGQLKHQQTPPPNPPPPAVNPQPLTGPTPAVHHLITSVAGQSKADVVAPPVFLPVPVIIIGSTRPKADDVSWLVLLILPSLVAVWVMVFARAAVTMKRRMRAPVAAA